MSERKRLWASLPTITFATLALAGFAYLGNYTRFMADDYCSAYYAERFGLLRSVWYWYITWSGRYAAFVFDWLILTKIPGPYGAHFVPPIAIAAWIAATVAAIYTSLKMIASRSIVLWVAIATGTSLLLAQIILSPDIAQSYFWLNGMRSYSLPLVILSIYAFLFQWILPRLKSDKAVFWVSIIAFWLTFANGGFSETYAVLQLVMLAFLTGLRWFANGRKLDTPFKLLASATLGAIASMIVVALSPGNALRKAAFPPSPGLIKLLEVSMEAYLSFIQKILFSPQKITAFMGAILVSAWAGAGYKNEIALHWWTIPTQVLGGLALSFISIPLAVYGYVEPPPARILSMAVFALVTFWMNAGFLIGSWLAGLVRSPARLEIGLIVPASLLIGTAAILTLSYVSSNQQAYIDLARKWDTVDAQILQARAQRQPFVNIPKMNNWAGLDRPSDNPKFWATACYSKYYDIQVFDPPY